MVNYKVELHTGNMLHAGTYNSIYIQLSGTKGESDWTYIKETACQDSVIEHQVACPSSLGLLEFVALETKPYALLAYINDNWFCSKVVVTTPEGSTRHFPCYNWLSGSERLVYREASGQYDGIRLYEREEELKIRHQAYQWSIYADGLPNIIKADSVSDLPDEVRFSFTKDSEFKFTFLNAMVELNLQGLSTNKEQWKNLEELSHVFNCRKTKVYEYIEKNWKKDEFFGYQFLNGINPMMINRCTKLPDNFPVTEDMVKASLSEKSLEEEMQDGNIFLVDYKHLQGVTANVINGKQHYLAAPLCLLYMTPEEKLMPIAIQLKQEPSEENPIFLPTDSEYDWLLAKTFVRNADFSEHELNSHLLRTHLLAEVFAVSTLRNLPMVHPIYKLLISHFRYTLQINIMARKSLISKTGAITLNASIGGPGMLEYLKKAVAELTYSSLCIPEDITARGMDDIPNFYYRDDGLKLWDIIHRFVRSVIGRYYTSDSDVQKDSELQNWIKDIFFNGFLSNASTGIPNSFSLVTELVKFLTMVIFTVSVQHAAVNNGQFDFGGWMPNFPTALQLPPPTTKGQCTEKTMLQTFPDINTTAKGIATVYLLSKPSSDIVLLGDYKEKHFFEKLPIQKIKDFKHELKVFSAEIKVRNERLELPYTYLEPQNIETSVAL
uniref:Arachidonate 15-lipoxygenase type B n=1 Tax=Esox lucius TaxID=8010 RepID=A0A6Q2WZP5_ESOLU